MVYLRKPGRERPEGRNDAESGSAPASRRAPDLDSESAAARPEPLGCVLWSSAYCLPASPWRQQSLSQTPGTGLVLRFRDLRLIKLELKFFVVRKKA